MFDNSKVTEINPMKPELRKENCEFTGMKKVKEKGKNNAEYTCVIFSFKDSTGAEVQMKEFQPSRLDTMKDEDYRKNISLGVSRMAHVSRAFLTEAEFLNIKVQGDINSLVQANVEANWNEYVKQTAMALGVGADWVPNKARGVKCALKVVYNESKGKYYSGLPKVPAFISTANHPKEFTNNPQYDIFEIPAMSPDKEKQSGAVDNGAGFGATQQSSNATTAPTEHASGF